MPFIVRSIVAAAVWAAASCVLSEVEIVDRPIGDPEFSSPSDSSASAQTTIRPSGPPIPVRTNVSTVAAIEGAQGQNGNPMAELFYQMQVIQQEVQELRGTVEEQGHLIKQLKQQRLDDYVDLDRRISALGGSSAINQGAESQTAALQTSSGADAASSLDTEKAHYQKAVDPILGTNKDLDAAIALLQDHLKRYPDGRYAGNAQYWLGEAYLVKDNLAESQQWFEKLLIDYPLHGKIPAAKFKLGIVYHKKGLMAQSRTLLEEVSRSNGPAAARASEYLNTNF